MNLANKAKTLRMNSVALSTRKSRASQWKRYLIVCQNLDWTPMPCSISQACKYVTLLSDELSYFTILTYYQSAIFMHVCAGLEPVRCSNPVLCSTLNGIKKSQENVQKGKDPIFPAHLRKIYDSLDRSDHIELVVFVAALLLFRTLLRVSHVVASDHTLARGDIKFNAKGCLVRVKTSKTSSSIGGIRYIPLTMSSDKTICPVRALKFLLGLRAGLPSEPLFNSGPGQALTYSVFSKKFKQMLSKAGIVGDFASHSLRRGGASYMSMVGCSIAQVKDRGGWASDCVFRYIKPSLKHNVLVDKKFAIRC